MEGYTASKRYGRVGVGNWAACLRAQTCCLSRSMTGFPCYPKVKCSCESFHKPRWYDTITIHLYGKVFEHSQTQKTTSLGVCWYLRTHVAHGRSWYMKTKHSCSRRSSKWVGPTPSGGAASGGGSVAGPSGSQGVRCPSLHAHCRAPGEPGFHGSPFHQSENPL